MAATRVQRLFVGNLPWTVGVKEIREHFSQFGFVATAHVQFDKESGMSKGYGFVQFANRESYVNATCKESHVIDGNIVTVQPASST